MDMELLEILACPHCGSSLSLSSSEDNIICPCCKLVYEIKDDVPVMILDETLSVE